MLGSLLVELCRVVFPHGIVKWACTLPLSYVSFLHSFFSLFNIFYLANILSGYLIPTIKHCLCIKFGIQNPQCDLSAIVHSHLTQHGGHLLYIWYIHCYTDVQQKADTRWNQRYIETLRRDVYQTGYNSQQRQARVNHRLSLSLRNSCAGETFRT